MATYNNCREILSDVRYGLNEHSTARLNGTDTSGKFQNDYLISKINQSQRYIYSKVFKRKPEWFLTSASLTASSSVFTLPADFSVLVYFRDENGDRVYPIDVNSLKRTNSTGSKRHYYQKGRTLVLDRDSVSDTYTLWYLKYCRDITAGSASAGAATSITLATSAKLIADYYNGMKIENVTQDWVDTIDDYTAARVATISETAASADYYGIVSELPEDFHHLIAARAIMMINAEHPLGVTTVTAAQKTLWDDEFISTLQAFCGAPKDVTIEEILTDFSPTTPTYGGILQDET